MSLITDFDTQLPVEKIDAPTLNLLVGSTSRVAALVNANTIDATNFSPVAGIGREQKTNSQAKVALPFNFPGVFTTTTGSYYTVFIYTPATGEVITVLAGCLSKAIAITGHAPTVKVYKQAQRATPTCLLTLTASDADTVEGDASAPTGESTTISSVKGEKLIVKLEAVEDGGTVTGLFGAVIVAHKHVSWSK